MVVALIAAMTLSEPQNPEMRELLDGVRVGDRVVEFGGEIAINCHHPETPDVYLEMIVTGRGAREHESLVVTDISASALHAALLAAGIESGAPWSREIPAHGGALRVLFSAGHDVWVRAEDWVMGDDRDRTLEDDHRWGGFVFAGSVLDERGYAADRSKTLVSLTVFGDETVSPVWSVSHDASIDAPAWIANDAVVPEKGTPIRVRIESVGGFEEQSEEPEGIDIDDG